MPNDDAASDSTLAAFVKSFEAALNASAPAEAPRTVPHDTQLTTPLPPALRPAADASSAFVPSVAPFIIDRVQPVAAFAPAVPAAPVDHNAIADQVLRGAFMRNVGQSSEMRLSLVPDSLGDVSVKLIVSAGSVTAHVVAETPEVRDALIAGQPQLAKSLADAGLKLTSFTVDLSGSSFAGFSQQQNDRPQNGQRSDGSTSSADTDGGIDETVLEAIPSFGPSIVAQRNAGDYNYLA